MYEGIGTPEFDLSYVPEDNLAPTCLEQRFKLFQLDVPSFEGKWGCVDCELLNSWSKNNSLHFKIVIFCARTMLAQ